MSGLAGILRTDGAPVDRDDLEAMAATMAHRAADGTGVWVDGSVGLAHLLTRTTTAAADEHQPLTDPHGEVWLTVDGRIDNRAELRSDLGTDRGRLRDGSDPELLLHAYLRWGIACLGRVVGEFAVALWDGRSRELLLARDFLGKRPLLYHHGATTLRWASELQAVLADERVSRTPNLAMVGERLSLSPQSLTETLFESVRRVPPAHVLVVADGRVRLERHWDRVRARPPRRPEGELLQELVDTFDAAVLAHLDAPGPVAAEVSGGLDSSSVVASADHLVRAGRASAPLELFGLVFPGKAYDETDQIRLVADHVGRPVTELQPGPVDADHYLGQIHHHLDLPEPPNMAMHRPLHQAAREQGARVLLTGKGGDEWFTGTPLVYADALRRLRLLTAWRTARAERRVWTSRGWVHQLVRDGLRPLLPDRLQRRAGGPPDLPPWMPKGFWGPLGLPDRVRPVPIRGPELAREDVARWLEHATLVHSTESSERTLSRAGLEARSPFDDRRVVELALALPESVRRPQGMPKGALRVAMVRVPPAVRQHVEKVNFVGVFYEDMAHQGGGTLFRELAIADLGWVDGTAVRKLWTALEDGHRTGTGHPYAWAIWTILSTERWARDMF